MSEKQLSELYEKFNYPSAAKFYQILKGLNIKVSTKEVQNFVNQQTIKEVHAPVIKNRNFEGHITAHTRNERWQMDLLDFQTYGTRNKNFNWILIVIDVFSRYAYARAIKTKSTTDVANALEDIFKEAKDVPHVIDSDNGTEFTGKPMQELLNEKKVDHVTNLQGDHNHLGVIDRFSKSIEKLK